MGSPRARRVPCPDCGAPIPLEEGRTTVDCSYCKLRSFLVGHRTHPRYYLEPRVSIQEASHTAMDRLVGVKLLTPRQKSRAMVVETELYFVPFFWVTAVTAQVRSGPGERHHRLSPILLEDHEVWRPACRIPDWGLEDVHLDAALESAPDAVLRPFERTRMGRLGRVLSPEPEQLEVAFHPSDHVAAERSKIVFYPVLSVHYRLDGALYHAALDGVLGRVLGAVAPEDGTFRTWQASAPIAALGLGLGLGIRMMMEAQVLGLLVLIFTSGIGVFVALAAWNLLRSQQELVYRGGRAELRNPLEAMGTGLEGSVLGGLAKVAEAIDEAIEHLKEKDE